MPLPDSPVITTPEGKGAISDRHYLSIGVLKLRTDPLREQLSRYDVILAVGTRFATANLTPEQQVVQIDVDEDEIGRNHPNTFGIVGDARRSLEEMYPLLSSMTPARPSRRAECEAIRRERFGLSSQLEPLHSFMQAIRAAIPDDGIFVPDITQIGYYSYAFYPVYAPRTFITSSYFGNLGYAYPTALGAKVARPDRAVVTACGDGGFLFNSQELATAVQHNINVVVIVFNDNAYGNVLRDEMTRFNGRMVGVRLHNPDFVKLAKAYGARGMRVEGPEQLESALREAIAGESPALIEVPVGMMPSPF